VLTSGRPPVDPSSLLAGQGAQELFRHIRTFDYSYILVDGPPIVGIADVQPLIRLTDEILFVARLDRFTIENIVDVQDLFGRLGVTPLGSVVLGARVDASPYYLNRPPISSAV
jgi:Mrp family chromosome partitioning ATPase